VTHFDSSPSEVRQQLEEIRRALVDVHKALLDAQRVDYEGEHGRVETRGAFLQLALTNSTFAWLHPLLALVVQIDEFLAADNGAATPEAAASLLDQARALLRPDEQGEAFQRRYHELLQDEPAVVMAHAAAMAVLRRGGAQGGRGQG
jgi:hypothetical protein